MRSPYIKNIFMFFYWLAMVGLSKWFWKEKICFLVFLPPLLHALLEDYQYERCVLPLLFTTVSFHIIEIQIKKDSVKSFNMRSAWLLWVNVTTANNRSFSAVKLCREPNHLLLDECQVPFFLESSQSQSVSGSPTELRPQTLSVQLKSNIF